MRVQAKAAAYVGVHGSERRYCRKGRGSVEYQSLEVLAKHGLLEFTQPVWYHRLGPMLCACMLAPYVAGASRCSPV